MLRPWQVWKQPFSFFTSFTIFANIFLVSISPSSAKYCCGAPMQQPAVLEDPIGRAAHIRFFRRTQQANRRLPQSWFATGALSEGFRSPRSRLSIPKSGYADFYNYLFSSNLLFTFSCKKGIVRDVLSALWASRKGLSEQELSELLSIPQALLSPLLIALENCLVRILLLYLFSLTTPN